MKNSGHQNDSLLVLPSWYPSETDPSSGDFIERHIEAIAAYRKQYIIFVTKEETAERVQNKRIVPITGRNFSGEIIYYTSIKTGITLLDKYFSDKKYIRLYKQAIQRYIKQAGKPRLLHVHVAQKAGRLAVWVKRKWKIPFVLSEHWTGYLPEADLKLTDFPFWFRKYNRKIIAAAACITVVSEHLGRALKQHYPFLTNYIRVPNVVKPSSIKIQDNHAETVPVFIHASTMSYQKNVEDILEALAILKTNRPNFLCRLYGPSHTGIHTKIRDLGLREHVRLEGNVAHEQLLEAMGQSTALIAYSRFETFGCVIIESHAAGVPTIVSDIPVFHELITDNLNGCFVLSEHPPALAEKLQQILDASIKFNSKTIQSSAAPYYYESVGAQFESIFSNLIQ